LGFDSEEGQEKGEHAPRTQRWIDGFRDICSATENYFASDTRVISIMDQPMDMFALFSEQKKQKWIDMLVRIRNDRTLSPGNKLFATMRSGAPDWVFDIEIKPVPASKKAAKKKEYPGRRYCRVPVEVRYHRIVLSPPRGKHGVEPIEMTGIHVRECVPSSGKKLLNGIC